ncbi:MAG: sodium-independent anion transporter [Clostridia bacterium]|nr:sodium-independent anion transporter [Clostridia bacterium]
MKTFQPKLFSAFKGYSRSKLINDIVAGIIVAIIALPLSIALALASGATPAQGLYTAAVAGLVIAFLGGSNVNISGPTAAFATIVAGVIAANGFEGLVIATVMAGIILIILGICRAGSLIKFMPATITVGFTSGVAVTILIGQIKDFLGLDFGGASPVEAGEKAVEIVKNIGTLNLSALAVGTIGLAIIITWNILGLRLKGKAALVFTKIPSSVVAIIVGVLIVQFTPLKAATIGSLYPDLSAGLPKFSLPSFDLDTVIAVIPSAFSIAILAAIESLLSCVVSDGMIGDKHNSNTELIAQGAGNICSGLFGGIPATGAIARTAANVKNGGRTPVAGIVHALIILLFLAVLMPVAKLIPMPIIAAILFMVAYNMSEWRKFVGVCKMGKVGDIIVLAVTFVLTVVLNLVYAIIAGIILSVIFYFINKAKVSL